LPALFWLLPLYSSYALWIAAEMLWLWTLSVDVSDGTFSLLLEPKPEDQRTMEFITAKLLLE
jgi:hypothetical protein